MKANELRIGNKFNFNDRILSIKSIELNPVNSEYYVKINEDYSTIKLWALQPIPLTEEILLKCGFEQRYNTKENNFNKDYYFHSNLPEKFSLYLPYNNFCIYVGNIDIKYLHQLQNLYFALTNQELIFNYGN